MTALYVGLAAIVVLAVIGCAKLRRHADRAWAEQRRRLVWVKITGDLSQFTAAINEAGRAIAAMSAQMRKLGDAMERDR